eukprot:3416990-Amphidinium_carterae.1
MAWSSRYHVVSELPPAHRHQHWKVSTSNVSLRISQPIRRRHRFTVGAFIQNRLLLSQECHSSCSSKLHEQGCDLIVHEVVELGWALAEGTTAVERCMKGQLSHVSTAAPQCQKVGWVDWRGAQALNTFSAT